MLIQCKQLIKSLLCLYFSLWGRIFIQYIVRHLIPKIKIFSEVITDSHNSRVFSCEKEKQNKVQCQLLQAKACESSRALEKAHNDWKESGMQTVSYAGSHLNSVSAFLTDC